MGRGGDGERFFESAERDLSEAESIAERGSMLVWQIEAALERTQLFLALHQVGWEGEDPAAPRSRDDSSDCSARALPSRWLDRTREKLDEVKQLVKQTERPYEPHVPDWDEWQPPEYVGVFKAGEIVGYHLRDAEIAALGQVIDDASGS